jgi:hypothetical protein
MTRELCGLAPNPIVLPSPQIGQGVYPRGCTLTFARNPESCGKSDERPVRPTFVPKRSGVRGSVPSGVTRQAATNKSPRLAAESRSGGSKPPGAPRKSLQRVGRFSKIRPLPAHRRPLALEEQAVPSCTFSANTETALVAMSILRPAGTAPGSPVSGERLQIQKLELQSKVLSYASRIYALRLMNLEAARRRGRWQLFCLI